MDYAVSSDLLAKLHRHGVHGLPLTGNILLLIMFYHENYILYVFM